MDNTGDKPNLPDLSSLRIDDRKRKGRSVFRWLGLVLFAAILITAGLGARSGFLSRKAEVEVVSAITPNSASVSALLNASGYVTPRNRASVAAKITGKVVTVYEIGRAH